MKKSFKFIGTALVAAWGCLFCPGTGFSQANLQVVAEVTLSGKEPITVKQLKSKIELLEKVKGQKLNDAEIRQVLDLEINERLALQAAKKDNVIVTDTEINKETAQLKQQLSMNLGHEASDSEFISAINEQFSLNFRSMQEFTDYRKKQLTIEKYLYQKKENYINEIKKEPSDAEIEKQYNARKEVEDDAVEDGGLTQKESVLFLGILSNSLSEAQNLQKEIGKSVKSFEEKAQELNRTSRDRLMQQVLRNDSKARLLFGEDAGQIFKLTFDPDSGARGLSGILKIRQGEYEGKYIILEVTDKCSKSVLKLGDKIFPYSGTLRDLIKGEIMQKKQSELLPKAQQELVDELRKGHPWTVNESNLKLVSG